MNPYALLTELGALVHSVESGTHIVHYHRSRAFQLPSALEPLFVDLADRTYRLGLTHVTSTTPWGQIVAQRIGSLIEVATFATDPPSGAHFALCVDFLGPTPTAVAAANAQLMAHPGCIAIIGLLNGSSEPPLPTPRFVFAIDPYVPETLPHALQRVLGLQLIDDENGPP